MRYLVMGVAAAALAAGAQAQQPAWGYFDADGSSGAGVQAANGAQFMLKCDKPGRGEVYAVVVSVENLVPPNNTRFQMRPAMLRFDDGAESEERWRFCERSAVAVNQSTERTLERLLLGLSDADNFRIRLNPERARWVEMTFPVTGAKDAIARVYESGEDDNPLG